MPWPDIYLFSRRYFSHTLDQTSYIRSFGIVFRRQELESSGLFNTGIRLTKLFWGFFEDH